MVLSRGLKASYTCAFVHKLREATAEELKGRILGGDGKVIEALRVWR